MSKKPLTDEEGEIRPLTREDFKEFKPFPEGLPPDLVTLIKNRKRGQRGPQKAPTKDKVALRLDHDLVEHFKAGGPGWQRRLNDTLRKATGLTKKGA